MSKLVLLCLLSFAWSQTEAREVQVDVTFKRFRVHRNSCVPFRMPDIPRCVGMKARHLKDNMTSTWINGQCGTNNVSTNCHAGKTFWYLPICTDCVMAGTNYACNVVSTGNCGEATVLLGVEAFNNDTRPRILTVYGNPDHSAGFYPRRLTRKVFTVNTTTGTDGLTIILNVSRYITIHQLSILSLGFMDVNTM